MLRRNIIKKLIQEAKGAVKLQVTANGNTLSVAKESATTPTRFKVLTTVISILYALPRKFLKNAETLTVVVEPTVFSIQGTSKEYSFVITSLPKNAKVEKDETPIPEDFAYFCKLFGISGGNNGVIQITFQLK